MYTFTDVKFLSNITNKDICNLKGIDTNELMKNAYMRAWIRFWLSLKRNSSIFSKTHYDNKELFLTDTFVIRSFVPSNKIAKFSAHAEEEFASESASDKISTNLAAKRKAASDDGIRIILKFKYENNFFSVSIANISTSDEEIFHVEDYRKALMEEISLVTEKLENPEIFTKKKLVHHIFDVLNTYGRSIATGVEIEYLWNIYFKAKEYYPDFASLDTKAQFCILQRAFFYASKANVKDIHTYAKEVIHVLHDKNMLSRLVYQKKEHVLIKQNYRECKRNNGKVSKALHSLEYKVGPFRATFKPFDLWNVLTYTSCVTEDE